MYHLPRDGAKVRVFPDPKFKVPVNPPQHGMAPSWMNPSGVLVEWDSLRYRQYLEGLIHLFDPRPSNDPSRRSDDPQSNLHNSEPPQHIKDQLKAIALEEGHGAYLEEATQEKVDLWKPSTPKILLPTSKERS